MLGGLCNNCTGCLCLFTGVKAARWEMRESFLLDRIHRNGWITRILVFGRAAKRSQKEKEKAGINKNWPKTSLNL